MYTYSKEHIEYLKNIKRNKIFITIMRISIVLVFLILWEVLARFKMINTFLSSSPSHVISTISSLISDNSLFSHIGITLYETIISFVIAALIGLVVASMLWWNKTLAKIVDPYLTVLNSLPKVALGPLIIIWVGASVNSIIFMALLISTFISIINIYNGFISTDIGFINLLKSLGASKKEIFLKVIIPSNYKNLINTAKVLVGMDLIGVIMGELLVSKKGLGYLIMYGSQVFNIDLVITSVVILGVISYLMYFIISKLEDKIRN